MVYFVTDGTAFKIGSSNNIEHRVMNLQVGNPRKLEVYKAIDGNVRVERYFQDLFSDRNIMYEWYDISKEDIDNAIIGFEERKEFIDISEDLLKIMYEHFSPVAMFLFFAIVDNFYKGIGVDENDNITMRHSYFLDACSSTTFYKLLKEFEKHNILIPVGYKRKYSLNSKYVEVYFRNNERMKS